MATVIDALIITMGLDPAGVDKGMDQVESRLKGGVGNIVNNIFAPLAGVFAFNAMISNFLNAADALGDLSGQLEIGVQDLDAWSQAAALSGGSAQSFQSTLQGLNTKILDATVFGKKMASSVFEELGIKLKDAQGKTKSTIEVLKDLAGMADSMDKVKFAGIARKLGLDPGTIMLLQSGSKEVDKLVGKMKDLAYTEKDAQVASDFNDQMDILGKTVMSTAAIFMRMFLPAVTFVAEKLSDGVNFLRKHESFVIAFFTTLAVVIGAKLLPALRALISTALRAAAPFLPLIAVIAGIALLIDDLYAYINGGKSALADFWAIFGTGEEISKALAETWEELKAVGTALWDGIKAAAAAFFGYFGGALTPLVNMFKEALKTIKALLTGNFDEAGEHIMNLLGHLGEYIVAVFTGAFNLVYDAALWIFKKIAAVTLDVFSGIADFFGVDTSGVDKLKAHLNAPSATDAVKASDALSPAMAAGSGNVDNSSETTINGGVQVYTQATDAQGIARDVNKEFKRMNIAKNTGVNQGGGR